MDFTDISSYSDAQVPEKLKELESNKEFLGYIASLLFPKSNKYFSWLSNAYVGWKFNKLFSHCNSIDDFQNRMAPLVKSMINSTTDGFSHSGTENLTDKPTLFIGNHRDISLDAAFLNYLLYSHKLNTVRIAIGDNLLDGGFAEILMRLNKSFVVHRDIKGVKETLRKLSKLSAYINHSIQNENESIWIAQKEGRANDGNDFTDESVLKMLYLDQRKNLTLREWVKKVNLTPVVISYEYDPLDIVKAKGWDFQEDWSSEQVNKNDLNEMASGIFGYKGRVHLHICKPITEECEDTEKLANLIQEAIISNYHLWPSNHSALSLLPKIKTDYLQEEHRVENQKSLSYFNNKLQNLDSTQKEEMLMIYARPIINKEKARLAPGP